MPRVRLLNIIFHLRKINAKLMVNSGGGQNLERRNVERQKLRIIK